MTDHCHICGETADQARTLWNCLFCGELICTACLADRDDGQFCRPCAESLDEWGDVYPLDDNELPPEAAQLAADRLVLEMEGVV